jgi:hypothetical protein
MTEAQVIEEIDKVTRTLAPKYTFGPYDRDDIKDQGWVYAIEVLDREVYDHTRPLANFLYIHVRNRLSNFKRDNLRRNDPPCQACHRGDLCGRDGEGSECKKYAAWRKRNQDKANIQRPLDLTHIADEKERNTRLASHVVEDVALAELLEKIDLKLPVELRQDYLLMRSGEAIPKARRLAVENMVKDILGDEVFNG